jgi:hypothetical protein
MAPLSPPLAGPQASATLKIYLNAQRQLHFLRIKIKHNNGVIQGLTLFPVLTLGPVADQGHFEAVGRGLLEALVRGDSGDTYLLQPL